MTFFAKFFDDLTPGELHGILRARAQIFIAEAGMHYVDPDDVDFQSLHIFGLEDGHVVAYLRAFSVGADAVKIGRVLTLTHGQGHGRALMNYAVEAIPGKLPCRKLVMDAQTHALPFYKKLGFAVTSEEYLEEGVPHVDMCLLLRKDSCK